MAAYLALSALYVALVAVILVALVTRRAALRPLAVLAGAAAMWLPYAMLDEAQGHPSPFPPDGNYRLLASRFDLERERVYVLLAGYDGLSAPRSYRVPLSAYGQQELPEGSPYDPPDVYISRGDGGELEVLSIDYEPPDPPKGTRNYGQIGND